MGRATQQKLQEKEQRQNVWLASFSSNNAEVKAKSRVKAPPVTDRLENYQQYALRPLDKFVLKTKSSNLEKQLLEAVRYAFGKYSVAQALSNVWRETRTASILPTLIEGKLHKTDLKQWYICVATGGSLYKEHAKPYLSKKEVHYFINCLYDIHPNQALCYAVAKAVAEKDEGVCLKISKSKLCEKPLTDFWKSVIRFLSINPTVTLNQINDLSDYLEYRHRENNTYSIAGHSLAALLKRMDDWHRDLQRAKALGDHRWVGFAMPDEDYEMHDELGNKVIWTFHQILNSKELAAEGNRMRHCVYSYKNRCVDGSLSIWSLSKQDMFGAKSPKVTIELRRGGAIAQARGLANRQTRNDEKAVMKQWMNRHNLSYGYGW